MMLATDWVGSLCATHVNGVDRVLLPPGRTRRNEVYDTANNVQSNRVPLVFFSTQLKPYVSKAVWKPKRGLLALDSA